MSWLLKRVTTSLVLIWIVMSIVFLAIRMVPGDPATLLLSQGGVAPAPAQVAALRKQLGLNRPIFDQYISNFRQLLHGNLGNSLQDGAPVVREIFVRLPRTLELIVAATIIALVIGLPCGLMAALWCGGIRDRVLSWIAALGLALPVFVLGTLMVLLFAQTLRWLPAGGYVSMAQAPEQHFAMVAMPATTLAFGLFSTVFRMTRGSVLDIIMRDHVRTAHAKGLLRWRVLVHHVLRNALSPVVTVLGLQFGTLLGGTVLVEYVFNYPGLSSMLVNAVDARDYPEVEGIVLVVSVLFVAINLAVDLLYGVLDPRVRRE